jgi:hypothetical protein
MSSEKKGNSHTTAVENATHATVTAAHSERRSQGPPPSASSLARLRGGETAAGRENA